MSSVDPLTLAVIHRRVGWVKRSADPTPFKVLPPGVGSSLTLDPTYTLTVGEAA
jgi:hypothetical protein